MSPEDEIRIRHMINATESALSFIGGRTRADLDTDLLLVTQALPQILAQLRASVAPPEI
jgi:hypothetical protein